MTVGHPGDAKGGLTVELVQVIDSLLRGLEPYTCSIHRHFIDTFEAKKGTAGSGPLPRPCWNSSLPHLQFPQAKQGLREQKPSVFLYLCLKASQSGSERAATAAGRRRVQAKARNMVASRNLKALALFVQAFVEPKCSDAAFIRMRTSQQKPCNLSKRSCPPFLASSRSWLLGLARGLLGRETRGGSSVRQSKTEIVDHKLVNTPRLRCQDSV